MTIEFDGQNNKLGTTTANSVTIKTNDTDAFTVDSNQNVGVGTATPTNFGSNFKMLAVEGSDFGVVQSVSNSGSVTTEMMASASLGYVGTRTNHPFVIRTNDTERMRVTDAGLHLGGTGAANALDDYEEGTFTPAIEGTTTAGTFTPNALYTYGRYTKVGRLVNIYFGLVYSSFTGTGNIRLTGLPFASENTYMQLPVSIIPVSIVKPTDSIVNGEILANSTKIVLKTFDTTSSSRPSLAVDAAGEFYISVTYHTG